MTRSKASEQPLPDVKPLLDVLHNLEVQRGTHEGPPDQRAAAGGCGRWGTRTLVARVTILLLQWLLVMQTSRRADFMCRSTQQPTSDAYPFALNAVAPLRCCPLPFSGAWAQSKDGAM